MMQLWRLNLRYGTRVRNIFIPRRLRENIETVRWWNLSKLSRNMYFWNPIRHVQRLVHFKVTCRILLAFSTSSQARTLFSTFGRRVYCKKNCVSSNAKLCFAEFYSSVVEAVTFSLSMQSPFESKARREAINSPSRRNRCSHGRLYNSQTSRQWSTIYTQTPSQVQLSALVLIKLHLNRLNISR